MSVDNVKYKDVVCGMWVSENQAKASVLYEGEKYYFCSQNCADKFENDPEKYLLNESSDVENKSMKNMRTMKKRMGHKGCHHGGAK